MLKKKAVRLNLECISLAALNRKKSCNKGYMFLTCGLRSYSCPFCKTQIKYQITYEAFFNTRSPKWPIGLLIPFLSPSIHPSIHLAIHASNKYWGPVSCLGIVIETEDSLMNENIKCLQSKWNPPKHTNKFIIKNVNKCYEVKKHGDIKACNRIC